MGVMTCRKKKEASDGQANKRRYSPQQRCTQQNDEIRKSSSFGHSDPLSPSARTIVTLQTK